MRFKITPPVASPLAVERTQVLDRVAQCAGIRLVLVRAPAGYGKTTTLAQLHRRLVALDVDCVWLQFDEVDNDVSRFVASVRHALVGAASLSGTPTQRALPMAPLASCPPVTRGLKKPRLLPKHWFTATISTGLKSLRNWGHC